MIMRGGSEGLRLLQVSHSAQSVWWTTAQIKKEGTDMHARRDAHRCVLIVLFVLSLGACGQPGEAMRLQPSTQRVAETAGTLPPVSAATLEATPPSPVPSTVVET